MADHFHPTLASVIVCVHDGEKFLAATLESALAQTHSELELIAVDDGSTDNSAAILDQCRDHRLRVIRQERGGAASALDAACQAVRGEYVALLDQDDLWSRDNLAVHVEALERHPEIDLTFSWFRAIDESGREIGVRSRRHRGTASFRALLTDFVIGASSNVVLRREAIRKAGGVDRGLPRYYDLDLFLRIALLRPNNVLAIPRDLMSYRRHEAQMSRDLGAMQQEWDQVLAKLRRLAPRDLAQIESRSRSNMNRYFALIAYETSQFPRGLRLLREGFRISPGRFLCDPRNWRAGAGCFSGLLLPPQVHRRLERLAGLRRNGH